MPRKPERLPEGIGSDDVLLSTASEWLFQLFRFSFPGFRSPAVFQETLLEQMKSWDSGVAFPGSV